MNRLKLLRFERGLTLEAVAEATGVGRQTLMRLERGDTTKPSAPTVKALADFYEVSVSELLGLDEDVAA